MSDILNKITNNIENPDSQNVNKIYKDKPLNYFNSEKLFALLQVEMRSEIQKRAERSYIRASEAGDCSNQLYLRLTNSPIDFDMATKNYYLPLMAHVGNAIHDFIQKKYTFTETELPRNSERFKIHCRVDGLIDNNVILEIKTVSNAKILREKDIYQVAANFLVLEDHGYRIRAGQLLYIERTLTRMETFEFPEEQLREYAKNLVTKINHIFHCIKEGQETTQFLEYKNCGWCEYNKVCSRKGGKK